MSAAQADQFWPCAKGQIAYRVWGQGRQLVFAFHGFADQARLFEPVADQLPGCKVYGFSLPFHGQTQWSAQRFEPEDLRELMEEVAQQEQQERFALIGFSMGGKVALKLAETLAERLDWLILLAPDGLKTHYLYDVVRFPKRVKHLVAKLLEHPRWFFALIGLCLRVGLLTPFLHDFMYNHLHTERRRARLFQTWDSLDAFVLRLPLLKGLIRQYRLPVLIVLGQRDQVIPPEAGSILAAELPAQVSIRLVAKGHLLVDRDLPPVLNDWLASQK